MSKMVNVNSKIFVEVEITSNHSIVSYGFTIANNIRIFTVSSFGSMAALQEALEPNNLLQTLKETLSVSDYKYFLSMIRDYEQMLLDGQYVELEQL